MIAISYQSDATPTVVMETSSVADGHRQHLNKGRRSAEFVLERMFAVAASGDRTVVLQWPLRLHDKTAWTHLSVAAKTMKYPFLYGCEAINITHVCFDGALFSSLSDLLHRHHARALADAAQAECAGEGGLLALRSWFVATPCMNHAAHCSARWPLKDILDDDRLMKDLWSIIESSRAAKTSVMDYAPWWLASRLVYRDCDHEHFYRFWTMLGIESADCDELCNFQLRVVDGTIFLAEDAETDPDIVNRVSRLLERVIRWRPWTDSRWLSIGDSTRTLLAALALGWSSLVEFARAQGHSTYHIQNLEKLRPDILGFAVKAAVSTFVTDAALGSLLSDDRLPMTVTMIEDEMDCELDYIATLPAQVWDFLSDMCHLPAHHLRSEAYSGALAAAAFLKDKFSLAKRLPWTLCDQPSDRLGELLAGDEPEEEVSNHIWRLGRSGYSKAELCDGIAMLGQLSWSQVSTEQGHSAASVVMKQHRMLGQEMMQCRSMILQMRCLFAELPEVKKLNHLRTSLLRLQARRSTIGGRQTYVQELLEVARGLRHTGQDAVHELQIAKGVFARHGVRWRAMTREQQLAYELRGQMRTRQVQEQQQESVAETKAAYVQQLRVVQVASEEEKLGPLRVGSCRLSSAEVVSFDGMWHDPSFVGKRVQEQCASAQELARPPPNAEQETLLTFPGLAVAATPPTMSWVRFMCKHRSFFRGTLVQLQFEAGVRFLATLLLQQSPYRAAFVEVVPLEQVDETEQARHLHAGKLNLFSSTFVAVRGSLLWSHVDELFLQECNIMFMKDVCFYDDDLVGSQDGWHPIEEFRTLLHAVEPDPRPDSGHRPHHRASQNNLFAENPWLHDVLGASSTASGFTTSSSHRSSSSATASQTVQDTLVPLQEMPMEEVVSELQRQRDLFMAELPDEPVQHFKTTLRGGAWIAMHVGAVADSARGFAATTEAKQFCLDHGLPQSATFALNRFGSRACALLSQYWVSKMSWLMASGSSSADVASGSAVPGGQINFTEPAFASELENGPAHTAARLRQLRALAITD